MRALILGLSMSLLAGCETGKGDLGGGGFSEGGSSGTGTGFGGAEATDVPAEPSVSLVKDSAGCIGPGTFATVPVSGRVHGYASAQYVRAALRDKVWPAPSLVAVDDFEGYYLDQLAFDGPVTFSAKLQLESTQAAVLEARARLAPIEVSRPPLIVLLDVSGSSVSVASVRDGLLQSLAAQVDAGTTPRLVLVSFGDEPVKLLDVGMGEAGEAVASLVLRPEARSSLREAVALLGNPNGADALPTDPGTHALIVTDAAFLPDEKLLAEIRGASSRGVKVSIAQLAPTAGADASGASVVLRAQTLEAVAKAGRGTTLFFDGGMEGDKRDFEAFFEARADEVFGVGPAGVLHITLPMPVTTEAPEGNPPPPDAPTTPIASVGASLAVVPAVCSGDLSLVGPDEVVEIAWLEGEQVVGTPQSFPWASLKPDQPATGVAALVQATALALRTQSPTHLGDAVDLALPLIEAACDPGSACAVATQLTDVLRGACAVLEASAPPRCALL